MAIGVAAVVVMVSMGRGIQKRVLDMIHDMGTNLIVVNAGHITLVGGRERQSAIVTTLRPGDSDAIQDHCAFVTEVAPETSRKMNVQWESENLMTDVVGVTPAAFQVRNIKIEMGRYFDSAENDTARRVALVGSVIVEKLFNAEDPVGHRIRIGQAPFEVVGVMKAKGVDANGVDRDDRILIPIKTAMRRLVRTTYIQKIHIQVAHSGHLQRAEKEIRELLRERHRLWDKPDDFTIQNQATLVQTEKESTRTLTLLVASVAAISLLVGGIGILAVMLTACRERRREIGLRRAVGARRRDIRTQFLLESLIIAGLGGFFGAALGMLSAFLASKVGGWPAIESWDAIGLGLILSAIVGLIFGIYPASKAAALEPIEALRAE
ncbi:MAG: ABC transporter permease [Candidatus Aminicenantes bacterium]|nr:ABC transporter permease [Candidatus Aminicenantes bacterium]MBL7083444.1 ABC transporter permease [Candidatus Aminicenantes bacterium]